MQSAIDDIIGIVAGYYGVERECVMSHSKRSKMPSHARHVAMYLSRTLTRHSLPEIGRSFDRDHTSVLGGVRKIETLLQSDEALKADIDLLSARFSSRVQSRRVA